MSAAPSSLRFANLFEGWNVQRGRATLAAPANSNTHTKESIMTITTLASTGKPTLTIGRSNPLLRVMAWELRRFCTSRLFWLQALGFFCLSSIVIWAQQLPHTLNHSHHILALFCIA